jgi:hypothetical protein
MASANKRGTGIFVSRETAPCHFPAQNPPLLVPHFAKRETKVFRASSDSGAVRLRNSGATLVLKRSVRPPPG